jgi:hypothetical protein
MAWLFNKLNTPKALVLVLVIALSVNGLLLLYQQGVTPPTVPPEEAAPDDIPDLPKQEEIIPPEVREKTEGEEREREEEPELEENGESRPESNEEEGSDPDAGEEPDLGGLGAAIRECAGDRKRCVQEFVAGVAPGASYIGGRTELDIGGTRSNVEVLYFEYPELGTCEYEREEHEARNGTTYTVILLGPGSFETERGEECIPRA